MKLYSSLGPNPRLVRMFLIEKGIEVERRHLDIITGENRTPAFAETNILQTLPVLELADGTRLTESTVICEYLEELHPDPNLIGRNPLERAQVRRWVRWFDQEVVVPMTMGFRGGGGRQMFEPRMRVVSSPAAAELCAMADEQFVWLDRQLGTRDHLVHGRFTLADLLVFCFISFGHTVGWTLPEGTPGLARLVEQTQERPSARVWLDSE